MKLSAAWLLISSLAIVKTFGEETTRSPEGSTSSPEGSTSSPEGSTRSLEGSTSSPEGSTSSPEGSTSSPEGSTSSPEELVVCPRHCPMLYDDPVCATDGATYKNECELKKATCGTGAEVKVAHRGKCEDSGIMCPGLCPNVREFLCETDHGTYYTECHLRHRVCYVATTTVTQAQQWECKNDQWYGYACNGCSSWDLYDPVCGNDGQTYASPCLFKKQSCDHPEKNLTIDYFGSCRADIEQCPKSCPDVEETVCGTDYHDYKNECQLKRTKCVDPTFHWNLEIAHRGFCYEYHSFTCDEPCLLGHAPVCGTDGKTYDNRCELRSFNCQNQNKEVVKIAQYGACEGDLLGFFSYKFENMICDINVDWVFGPAFPKRCFLDQVNCSRKEQIEFVRISKCRDRTYHSELVSSDQLRDLSIMSDY